MTKEQLTSAFDWMARVEAAALFSKDIDTSKSVNYVHDNEQSDDDLHAINIQLNIFNSRTNKILISVECADWIHDFDEKRSIAEKMLAAFNINL